jgi:hypothetical protein
MALLAPSPRKSWLPNSKCLQKKRITTREAQRFASFFMAGLTICRLFHLSAGFLSLEGQRLKFSDAFIREGAL